MTNEQREELKDKLCKKFAQLYGGEFECSWMDDPIDHESNEGRKYNVQRDIAHLRKKTDHPDDHPVIGNSAMNVWRWCHCPSIQILVYDEMLDLYRDNKIIDSLEWCSKDNFKWMASGNNISELKNPEGPWGEILDSGSISNYLSDSIEILVGIKEGK